MSVQLVVALLCVAGPSSLALLSPAGRRVGGAGRRLAAPAQVFRHRVSLAATEDDEVARLQEAAERLRAEVAGLEKEREDMAAAARETVFRAFDKNKDGVVEPAELQAGLETKYGIQASDSQLEEIFREFDTNKDGKLQLSEFQVDLIRGRVEALQAAEKAQAMEARRLEREAKKLEMERASVQAMFGSENTENGLSVRLLSVLPYLLPLADSAVYGRYILASIPLLGNLLAPLVLVYRSIPLGGLLLFWFFSTSSQNRELPRLLRFNLQQAILIDIALFLPSLVGIILNVVAPAVTASLEEPGNDLLFGLVLASISYASVATILTGKSANKIPIIGENAERAIGGPFDWDGE